MGGAVASVPANASLAKASLQVQTLALRSQMTVNRLLDVPASSDDVPVQAVPGCGTELPSHGQRATEAVKTSVAQVKMPASFGMKEMLMKARRESYVVSGADDNRVEASTLRDTEAAWKRAAGLRGEDLPKVSNAERRNRFSISAKPSRSKRPRRYSVGDPDAPECPPWEPEVALTAASKLGKLHRHYPFSDFSRVKLEEHLANASTHASYYSSLHKGERSRGETEIRGDDAPSHSSKSKSKNNNNNNNDDDDDRDNDHVNEDKRMKNDNRAVEEFENDNHVRRKFDGEHGADKDKRDQQQQEEEEVEDDLAGFVMSDEDDEKMLDALDAVEATRRAAQRIQLNEVLTQVTMLECAANRYRALSGSSWRPSRVKFTQQVLRPLFLDMMRTHAYEHVGLDPIEEIAKTRIVDFLDAYMAVCAEKLDTNRLRMEGEPSRAKMLADYCVLHGCSFVKGYEELCAHGWDVSRSSLGLKAFVRDEEYPVGTDATLEALCASIRAIDLTQTRRAIPRCTDTQIAQGLLLAISADIPDSRIIRLLLKDVNSGMQRKALLLAASRDRVDVLVLLGRLLSEIPHAVLHEALIVGAKRGALRTVRAMMGFADHATLEKAIAIAAAMDHVHIVRRLLPLMEPETWKILWAMGGERTKRFHHVLATQERFRWARYGTEVPVPDQTPRTLDATSRVCHDFLHVDLLLSTLQVLHGITFDQRSMCDLEAGAGHAVLAACLSQSFRRAVGFEEDRELSQRARLAVERFEADMENLFVPSFEEVEVAQDEDTAATTTSIPEIHFKKGGRPQQQAILHELQQAHLILTTPMAVRALDVRALRDGAVLAVYAPSSDTRLVQRKRALCKLHRIKNPVDGSLILWDVYLRRNDEIGEPFTEETHRVII